MSEGVQSPRGQGRREVVPAVPQAMQRERNISMNYPIPSKSKYSAWCIKMEVYMKAHGVWEAVESEEPVEKRKDKMALAAIYQFLSDETLLRLGVKRTAKEAWESLRTMHLGARRVKEVRAHGATLTSLHSRDVEDSIQQIPTGCEGDIRPVNQACQPNQEELSHDLTCSRNLTHEVITEKKNRIKSSPHKEDIQVTSRRTCKEPEKDQRLSNETLRSNQEDLSNDSTCSRNLTQEGIIEKKNWLKISTHEEDIQLTSQMTCNEPERDQLLLIEEFRSNQGEPSFKSTCFGSSTHQRFTENWNLVKISYGLKVIQLLNQEMPGLPYLQAHGFNHLQTRFWRPGEAHNHSGGTYKHPGRSFIILEGLDLRTNPFKGGGDCVILDGPDSSNSLSTEEDYQHGLLSLEEEALDVCCGPLELIQKREIAWVQEKDVTKAHMFKTAQVKEAEIKFIKRLFHVWCWTCTRKKRRSPRGRFEALRELIGVVVVKTQQD